MMRPMVSATISSISEKPRLRAVARFHRGFLDVRAASHQLGGSKIVFVAVYENDSVVPVAAYVRSSGDRSS